LMKRQVGSKTDQPRKKLKLTLTVAQSPIEDLQQFTVNELKNYLQANELNTTGNKAALLERVQNHKGLS